MNPAGFSGFGFLDREDCHNEGSNSRIMVGAKREGKKENGAEAGGPPALRQEGLSTNSNWQNCPQTQMKMGGRGDCGGKEKAGRPGGRSAVWP